MKQENISWPQILWKHGANFILACLALLGTAFSVVSAYDIPMDRSVLLCGCLGSMILFLCLFSLKKFRLPVIFSILLLGALAVWEFGDTLVLGVKAVAGAIYNLMGSQMEMPILSLEAVSWDAQTIQNATWFLLSLFTLLAFFLIWIIVCRPSFLGVFLLTFPWLLPAFLAELLPNWLPWLALVASWILSLLGTLCCRNDRLGGSKLICICTLPVAAFLLLLTIAIPQESYQQPAWALSARDWVRNNAIHLSADGQVESVLSSLYPGGSDTSVRLDADRAPSYTGRTVLRVESDYEGRVYLRGTSAADYSGDAWEPLSDETYAEIGLDDGQGANLLEGYEPLNFPSMTAPGSPYYEMDITYVSSLNGMMFTPYQLLTVPEEIEDVEFVNDSHLERRFGVRSKNLFFRPYALPNAEMQELSWDAARAEAVYRMFVYEHYLDVPPSLQEFLWNWLTETTSEHQVELSSIPIPVPSVPENQHRIALSYAVTTARILEVVATYDLDAPIAPEGQDFVEFFLSESHTGYCIHFATAGTLLLRSLGIPARYVTGYTADLSGGVTEVPDSAAHAWVEIYLDGYGWYPVEMTPAALGETAITATVMPEEPADTEVSQEPDEPEEPEEKEPEGPSVEEDQQDPAENESPEEQDEAPGKPGEAPVSGGLALLLAVLLLVGLWLLSAWLRRWLWKHKMHAEDTNAAVIAAYGYLLRLGRWGIPMDPEIEQLAEKARFSQHRLSKEEQKAVLGKITHLQNHNMASKPWWKQLYFRWLWIP